MLAQTAIDAAEALAAFGADAAFEWTMDGARIQVHKRGADVPIHARALNGASRFKGEDRSASDADTLDAVRRIAGAQG